MFQIGKQLVYVPEMGQIEASVAETHLAKRLQGEPPRPDAIDAFRLARRRFKRGERVEMGELAIELGVGRTTLFRWVGSRDQLLAEILWSLTQPTFQAAVERAPGQGGARIAHILGDYAEALTSADYFRDFLHREPERALRLLTTSASAVQQRAVEALENVLVDEFSENVDALPLPVHDLAYLMIRILSSFVYSDLITGETPDPAKVRQAVSALLQAC
jgi:AcrR family transcriptional regulator